MSHPSEDHSTRRMGTGMIITGCLIGLALLTLFFDGQLKRLHNPNARPDSQVLSDGSIAVVLERNRQGHYVMNGRINGIDTEFILDTGATDVVIPSELAERAGLRRGQPRQAMTANGVVTTYSTTIEQLDLGDIRLQQVNASINPAMDRHIILLGMSALRQLDFSQQGGRLTLQQRPGDTRP